MLSLYHDLSASIGGGWNRRRSSLLYRCELRMVEVVFVVVVVLRSESLAIVLMGVEILVLEVYSVNFVSSPSKIVRCIQKLTTLCVL